MIEVIGALFRWLQLASNMILIGGCVFLAIAVRANTAFDSPWLSPPGSSVTVAVGHASAGLGWLAGHHDGAGHGRSRKCLASGSLARSLTKNPHRTHLDGTRYPCTSRVRSGPLHSVLILGALAVCAVRDRRRAHAGCWIIRKPLCSRRAVRHVSTALRTAYRSGKCLVRRAAGRSHSHVRRHREAITRGSGSVRYPDPEAFLCDSAACDDRCCCHRHHRCRSHGGHELCRIGRDELRLVSQYKACVARTDSRDRRVRAPRLDSVTRPEHGCGCSRRTRTSKVGHRRSHARVGTGVGGDIAG